MAQLFEEFTSFCELEHQNRPGFDMFAWKFDCSVLFGFNNVDKMLTMEFGEELGFALECLDFALSWEIDFDCVQLVGFSTQIDAKLSGLVLGLTSFSEESQNAVVFCVAALLTRSQHWWKIKL